MARRPSPFAWSFLNSAVRAPIESRKACRTLQLIPAAATALSGLGSERGQFLSVHFQRLGELLQPGVGRPVWAAFQDADELDQGPRHFGKLNVRENPLPAEVRDALAELFLKHRPLPTEVRLGRKAKLPFWLVRGDWSGATAIKRTGAVVIPCEAA